MLGVDPERTTLFDLCDAMDDDILHPKCALGIAECSDARACSAHAMQVKLRAKQIEFLKSTTVLRVGEFNASRADCRTTERPPRKIPIRRSATGRREDDGALD